MIERVGYCLHHYPHINGKLYSILEIHSIHVINKQENILLKNDNNSSLVGTNRPPNH
jgi:hypothetical protein